jgi:hypothetical protein
LRRPPSRVFASKRWTARDKALLGKRPDTEVAARTGHSLKSVAHLRRQLGIPYLRPKLRRWTAAEDALLGTMPDRELADRLGRSAVAVMWRRVARGLLDPSRRRHWTRAEERLLGTAPDAAIATALGRTVEAVALHRGRLRRPAFRRRTGESPVLA